MLRSFKRPLMLFLALVGLGIGSAAAEPLTKYTVTYGDTPAMSAAPVRKALMLAAAPQAIHTITFNVTGDDPFSIPVQDGNDATIAIELPIGYTYVTCTVDGLNVEKDYWTLVDKGIFVDIEEGVFEFIQVDESHTVTIECTLPKYVTETGDDLRGDGSREKPVRTIGRGIALIDGKPGCIVVDKGTYPPFSCDNFAVNIIANGIDVWPVIDGGGTNRCATMGRAVGENLVHLEGFVLRNGYTAGNGGGAVHGSLDRCIIEDCRADGAGGGVAFADVRNSFVSACRAAEGNLVANSSLCGCTCRDNAPKGVSFASSGLRNSVVSCEGGATFESACTFDHTVSNAVFVSSYDWKEYRLAAGSPGLVGGDLNLVREEELDLEGKPRKTIAGGRMTVDCGCYENSGAPVPFCTVRGTFRGYNPFGTNTFRLGVGGAIRLPEGGYRVVSASVDGVPVSPTPGPGDILVPSAREGLAFTAHCIAMRYADAKNGNDANDGLTPDTAKKTLQAAIGAAPDGVDSDGSLVYAAPGTYAPIATANRKLTIIGTEGAAKTVIDGRGESRCANLGDERYECRTNTVLRGFTVQNGRCDKYGGGVWGGTVIACVIADNVVNDKGGGVAWSTVRESLITRNVNNYDGSAYGGGCYCGNYFNCTIVGNSAPNASGSRFSAGVYDADKLINCVVQENYGKDGVERNTYLIAREVATVTNGADFADAAQGDWHLVRGSAGVGTGDLAYVMDATDLDGLNRTTTNAEGKVTVNCGCYERVSPCLIHVIYTGIDPYGTNEFREANGNGPLVPRGYAVTELTTNGVPVAKLPQIGEPLVTGVRARMEVVVRFVAARYADAKKGSDENDGLSPEKAKKTLQVAIDIAPAAVSNAADSIVFAAPGTYAPIATANRKLTIFGTEGAEKTIIDGGGTSRCADLSKDNSYVSAPTQTNTVLAGFTVCNAYAQGVGAGAGVRGGTVVACVVTGNVAIQSDGGGCAVSVVRESLIVGNRIAGLSNPHGAGTCDCWLYNCTVVSNSADYFTLKHAISYGVSGGRVVNCIVQGNASDSGEEVNVWGSELVHTVTNGAVFADAASGDYHLVRGSAGIAAGNVDYVEDATDLDGAARLTKNAEGRMTVNCGCYETIHRFRIRVTYTGVDPYGTNEFLEVEGNGPPVPRGYAVTELALNGMSVAKLPQVGEPLVSGVMADTEVVARFTAQRYADAANGDDANDGLSPDMPKKTLQAAVDVAPAAASNAADSIVFAAPGTYAPIATANRMLTIVGTEGAAKTIIDGGDTSRCADLSGDGTYTSVPTHTNTVLMGFTVRKGRVKHETGAGVRGGTVVACVVSTNVAESNNGAGCAYSVVRESLITGNLMPRDYSNPFGAGTFNCRLYNCTVVSNSTGNRDFSFGGCCGISGGFAVNCIVQGNVNALGEEWNIGDNVDHAFTVTNGAKFVDAANGDYHLVPGSAGIAAGDVSAVVEATDLEGAARLTTNGLGQVTVNCGCYETVKWAKIWLTYTGVVPYGVDVFTAVGGSGPIVPRGYVVTELAVNGEPVAKLPQVGEPLVSGITEDAEVVVRFIATRYADAANGDDANDGFSPDKAKKTLQKAIDLAPEALLNAADSVVFAAPGTYAPIATANRMLTIIGTEGAAKTIIDAGGMGRCAELASSVFETSHPMSTNTVLVGFTVRNGKTISYSGPGVYCGTVIACVLSNNVAIAQNGAGCALSVVRETLITDNRILNQVSPSGAGAYKCWLYNCTVVANSTSNTDFPYGGTCGVGGGRTVNCIVQGNVSASGEVRDVGDDVDHAFTVTNGAKFVDVAAGDCHLKAGSAGIAAGDVTAVMDATDLDGAARLTVDDGTVTVNCGCYETVKWAKIRLTYTGIDPYGTNAFTAVGGFGPIVPRGYAATELAVNGAPVEPLPQVGEPLVSGITEDAEVVVHFTAQRYADAANGDDANDGLSPDMAKKTLQAAINIAPNGRTAEDSAVFAAPGTYAPIATANRMLTIIGTEGAAKTIIDGGGASRCADLGGGNYEGLNNTVLRGFTVRNGRCDKYGGGVRGGMVIACVIADNVVDDYGGGGAWSVVRESLITRNVNNYDGSAYGGGCYYGNYFNCTIVGNSAPNGSGDSFAAGVYGASELVNCVVQGNYGKDGVERNTRNVPRTVATVTNGAVFTDAANGDYHLKPGSAGIAAGDVGYVIDSTDLEGAARLTTNAVAAGDGKLPAGYTAVEYIESTPGGRQYINTGYVPKTTTRVDCVVSVPDGQQTSFPVVFGSHSASDNPRNKNMSFFAWFNGSGSTAYNRGDNEKQGGAFDYNSKVRLVCEGLKASWSSVDEQRELGEITNAGEIQDGDERYPLYIFALDEPNAENPGQPFAHTYLAMKLYSFKIYEGEKRERDFVPCLSPSGEAGLYDTVYGKFYGNVGGGRFGSSAVTVNCGCYETVKEPVRFVKVVDDGETHLIPYAWLETYGLAPCGSDYETHYASATNVSANPVGPGATAVLPAWKSYVAGLDPTNVLEMFYAVIASPSNGWFRVGPNEVRQGRAYAVRETGVLRGAAVTNVWPIAEGQSAVDVKSNGTNSFFKVNVRVSE